MIDIIIRTCFVVKHLSSQQTGKGWTHHSPLGWHFRQASGEQIDIVHGTISVSQSGHRPRTHDVSQILKSSDCGQPTKFPPFSVPRQPMIPTLLNDLSHQVQAETILAIHKHFVGHLLIDM